MLGVAGEGIAGGGAGECRVSGDDERVDGGKCILRTGVVMVVRESRDKCDREGLCR